MFDLFENKDQIFQSHPTFSDEYLLEKYGTEIKTSDGVYHVSDFDYSTRQNVMLSLKKDEYKYIVDLKYRMKRTDSEITFILFEQKKTFKKREKVFPSLHTDSLEQHLNLRLKQTHSFDISIQNIKD